MARAEVGRWGLAVVLVALPLGCGGSSGGEGGVELSGLPGELAAAYCEASLRCYPFAERSLGGLSECTMSLEAQVRAGLFAELETAVEDGRALYDEAAARRCLETQRERACDELDDGELSECARAVFGTVARGGACSLDAECEGASVCAFDAACPGVCVARLSAGRDCAGEGSRCADGLVCSEATGKCATPAALGEECGHGVEVQCEAPLFCGGGSDEEARPGTCQTQAEAFSRAEGESCSLFDGPLCAGALHCVLDELRAGPEFHFTCRPSADEGGKCGLAFPNQCPVGQYCAELAPAAIPQRLEGSCTDLPTVGEACGDAGFAQDACARGAVCVDGTCEALRDNGGRCERDGECVSGHCDAGGCASAAGCR